MPKNGFIYVTPDFKGINEINQKGRQIIILILKPCILLIFKQIIEFTFKKFW